MAFYSPQYDESAGTGMWTSVDGRHSPKNTSHASKTETIVKSKASGLLAAMVQKRTDTGNIGPFGCIAM